MRRWTAGTALTLATLFVTAGAQAQKATERYIPVGQSPGISGEVSYIGRIERVDAEQRTLAVAGPRGTWTARVTETTKIWLDRTPQGLSNLRGAMADCRPGRRVEVHYVDPQKKEVAEWIKVVIDGD